MKAHLLTWASKNGNILVGSRRHSQVVRQSSAKALFPGSNLGAASNFLHITEGGSQFMAKAKRGKNIKTLGWRGTCPSCQKTGVKLLWEKEKLHVCKACGK